LLLKPSLLKRQVGELVNVFVCMNVANGNSSQLIPSTGTAARNVTSRPGGGRCVERTRHIDEVSKGGFAVASSHKPIANVENSGQSKLIVQVATGASLLRLNHRCRNSVVLDAATLYDESSCANAGG
jgi:hypothetical protein